MNRFYCLLLLVACAAGFSSCGESTDEAMHYQPVEVTALTVRAETIPANFEYVGVAQSSHLVEIRARVQGYLQSIDYVEGSFVNEGDILFQIDAKSFKAKLESAEAELAKQKAILWNATRAKERLEPLFKKNAASRKDLDDAIASELTAEADVATAKANLVQAGLDLGYTTISTPISGLSGPSKYREGALITPGAEALLTTVSVIDPIWVNFSVSEGDVLKYERELRSNRIVGPVDSNFHVRILLADGSTLPDVGKVDFTDPSFNQGTGTLNVRATLPNKKGILRPGQFVRVIVEGAKRPNAIVIPQRAVLQGKKGMFVYVIDKEQKAQVRYIEPGSWYLDDWIVKEGLVPGDVVVVDGINRIQPGGKVVIKQAVEDLIP